MGLRDRVTLRKRWRNDTGNEGIDPLRQETPRTRDELCALVREAERDGCTVRAVGSGHSWSDVALTDGILLHPTGLTRPLDLEAELLRVAARATTAPLAVSAAPGTTSTPASATGAAPATPADPPAAADPSPTFVPATANPSLVRVESGMTIAALNAYLGSHGLGLPNMGGFDGQTVAGVMSTSTHGSGLGFGPLTDLVRSLDVVAAGGVVHRIEPQDGPTDPDAYRARHPEHELHQDDRWFDAAVVGMGCMGLIHSLILEVGPAFYLREVRTLSTWSQVREELDEALERNVHYEVLFSPYPNAEGEIECLTTARNPIGPSEYRKDHRRSRSWLMELAARFPLTPTLINLAVGLRPQISPFLLRQALQALVNPDYVNVSYRVFNIGAANYLPAYSAEIGVPVDERDCHLAAVDRIVAIAKQRRELGEVYHSSPISLRFVKASRACMSMMEGRNTMMIELIMATHTVGGMELLAAHEAALYELEGRPHWGQVNTLTGSNGLVESLYPRYREWQEVHAALNESGVFDGPFSKRVGLSL